MKSQIKILLGVIIAIVIIVSCEDKTIPFVANTYNLSTRQISDTAALACQSDPYELIETYRKGNTLCIKVAYSGGCEEHEFALHSDLSGINLSSPVLVLTLVHNANNDFCEAYLGETLEYDLEEVIGAEVLASLAIVVEKCE